ncbi:MAG: double-strand break repair protein AddB, partial [Candidatus Riflebacteria bacterium]|nr:double-strand break repair protein AddB [Candidatus Riflebacteria bacterium]
MAIQIVTGDFRQNKKAVLIEKILQLKEQDPAAKIYYIVPEHLKFEMEAFLLEVVGAVNESPDASIIDIQVASFSRLAWFLLGAQHDAQMLSDLGLTMIIRQVLQDYQAQLHVYAGQVNYHSFSEQLLLLFKELIEGNIAAENIQTVDVDYAAEDIALSPAALEEQRLAEIQLLYAAFLEALEKQIVGNYT